MTTKKSSFPITIIGVVLIAFPVLCFARTSYICIENLTAQQTITMGAVGSPTNCNSTVSGPSANASEFSNNAGGWGARCYSVTQKHNQAYCTVYACNQGTTCSSEAGGFSTNELTISFSGGDSYTIGASYGASGVVEGCQVSQTNGKNTALLRAPAVNFMGTQACVLTFGDYEQSNSSNFPFHW